MAIMDNPSQPHPYCPLSIVRIFIWTSAHLFIAFNRSGKRILEGFYFYDLLSLAP